jgi:proline iminopeptidase
MAILKRIARWLLWIVAAAILAVIGLLLLRAILQRQIRVSQAIVSPPGIDSMEAIELGGIHQWIHIRGRDRRNPVLLYLHGGPATPMMPFAYKFQPQLEGAFTVVEWDQRGAGKTYFANDPEKVTPTVTFDRMEGDALELVNYLRQRFSQPKVFVIGHSWGSMLGLTLVHDHPELFYAYVGTGQVVNVRENERVGYAHVLAEAFQRHDSEGIRELTAIAPYPDPVTGTYNYKENVVRKWEFRYGFALYGKTSLYREILKLSFVSPDYSLRDFSFFITDVVYDNLQQWVDKFDAHALGPDFQVPIILISGRTDWQVPGILAEDYLNTLSAPSKGFYWVEQASHSAMVEQPTAFARIMIEHVRPFAPATPP